MTEKEMTGGTLNPGLSGGILYDIPPPRIEKKNTKRSYQMLPSSGMYPGKESVIDFLVATNEARNAVHIKDGQKPLDEIVQHYWQGEFSFEECCNILQETFGTTWTIDSQMKTINGDIFIAAA